MSRKPEGEIIVFAAASMTETLNEIRPPTRPPIPA